MVESGQSTGRRLQVAGGRPTRIKQLGQPFVEEMPTDSEPQQGDGEHLEHAGWTELQAGVRVVRHFSVSARGREYVEQIKKQSTRTVQQRKS